MANGIKSHIMTKVTLGVLFLISLGIAVLVGLDRISLKKSIEGKTGELDNFRSEGSATLIGKGLSWKGRWTPLTA
jgi:hypothetical protein